MYFRSWNPPANEKPFYGAKDRVWIRVHNEGAEGRIMSRVEFLVGLIMRSVMREVSNRFSISRIAR